LICKDALAASGYRIVFKDANFFREYIPEFLLDLPFWLVLL